jgi:hypothetical protein
VRRGAAPPVLDRFLDQPRAHWIELNIADETAEALGLDGAGIVAALPQVAAAAIDGVPVLGIAHLNLAQQLGEGFDPLGPKGQMDVIGHEAVAQDIDGVKLRVLLEQAEVYLAVGEGEEDVASLVASLGDVMGAVWDHYAGESGHIGRVAILRRGSQ